MIIGPLTLESKTPVMEKQGIVCEMKSSVSKTDCVPLVIGSFFLYKCLFGHLGTYKSEAYLLVDSPLLLVLTKGAKFYRFVVKRCRWPDILSVIVFLDTVRS